MYFHLVQNTNFLQSFQNMACKKIVIHAVCQIEKKIEDQLIEDLIEKIFFQWVFQTFLQEEFHDKRLLA